MNNSKNNKQLQWMLLTKSCIMRIIYGMGTAILLSQSLAFAAEEAVVIAAPAFDEPKLAVGHTETMVVAGGCFWGVQGVYQHVKGVSNAVSGYAGGKRETAEYDQVSTGRTGHAEAVQITYDPSQVTYGQLLQVFFSVVHNPTELNHQGADTGTQYRSAVFPLNDTQRKIAQNYVAQLQQVKSFKAPIVTSIETLKAFYPAEAYHQDFLSLNPNHPYIARNDLPKISHLKIYFPNFYQEKPVLVKNRA